TVNAQVKAAEWRIVSASCLGRHRAHWPRRGEQRHDHQGTPGTASAEAVERSSISSLSTPSPSRQAPAASLSTPHSTACSHCPSRSTHQPGERKLKQKNKISQIASKFN